MVYNSTSLSNINISTPTPTTIQPTTLEQMDNVEDAALLAFKRPRGPPLVMKAESSSSQMVSPTPSGCAIKKERDRKDQLIHHGILEIDVTICDTILTIAIHFNQRY